MKQKKNMKTGDLLVKVDWPRKWLNQSKILRLEASDFQSKISKGVVDVVK